MIVQALRNVVGIPSILMKRKVNRPHYPKVLTLLVNLRCNLKCQMCNIWKMSVQDYLSTRDLERSFDESFIKHLMFVRITGGEPFLNRDLEDIIRFFHTHNQRIIFHLTTNGVLTTRIATLVESLWKSNVLLNIQVSVDGIGDVHDEIRGVDGTFDRVVETLDVLAQAKQWYPNLSVGLNQVITKKNKDSVHDVFQLAQEYGFEFDSVFALKDRPIYQEITQENIVSPDFVCYDDFSRKEISAILKTYEKLILKRSSLNALHSVGFLRNETIRYYLIGLAQRLLENQDWPNPKCLALFATSRVNPNGDVVPCTYITSPVGNIKEQSFSEIWDSDHANEMRKIVKSCSGCWTGCEVIPNAIYSGDMIKFYFRNMLLPYRIPF